MPKTLLNGVNQVLIKAQIVSSKKLLSSLTNSGKQVFIDQAVQAWNEAIDQLYYSAGQSKPDQSASATITLVDGQRRYPFSLDMVRLKWPLHDETQGQYIDAYPGGYERLRKEQSHPSNYTGQPQLGVIMPDNGELYLDRIPTSAEAGRVYTYLYDKELELANEDDLMPFNNPVFRAMVPVVTELYRAYKNNKRDEKVIKMSYGRAARLLNKAPSAQSWICRRSGMSGFDPFA